MQSRSIIRAVAVLIGVAVVPAQTRASEESVDLAKQLSAGKLRAVNREVTVLAERNAIYLSEAPGTGIVWVEGTEFASGTIEVDIRGRDLLQRSFVGIAFHRKDDTSFEAVYLRPFNFRSADPRSAGLKPTACT
jgi:hypothetical protein